MLGLLLQPSKTNLVDFPSRLPVRPASQVGLEVLKVARRVSALCSRMCHGYDHAHWFQQAHYLRHLTLSNDLYIRLVIPLCADLRMLVLHEVHSTLYLCHLGAAELFHPTGSVQVAGLGHVVLASAEHCAATHAMRLPHSQ